MRLAIIRLIPRTTRLSSTGRYLVMIRFIIQLLFDDRNGQKNAPEASSSGLKDQTGERI